MSWNVLYLIDAFAIALFVSSYYRNCYVLGYRVDIWHVNLFLTCVFPNLLMLPFARSELNGAILGRDYGAVMAALPSVFEIVLVGYFSLLLGGMFWRLRLGLGVRKALLPILEIPPRCSRMLMSSRQLLLFHSSLCLLLQLIVLSIYFYHNGFGFDLRAYTFANPGLRPVALLASNYTIVIAAHCLARYVDKKERSLLACTLSLTVGLIFFGARSNIVAIYITVVLCSFIRLRNKINLFRIISLGVVVVVGVLYLGSARAGRYSLSQFFVGIIALLLFGNTFSDLRDFAWVYSGWDHAFWAGKTYLAAFAAFVPRVASAFRDTWGLGVATARTVGFDPQLHPGLRPGVFGEGFFNFGLLGVVGVGLMLGIITRRVDIDVKHALAAPRPSMVKAFASTTLLGVASNFALTAGFSSLYILIVIFLFSWVCLRVVSLVKPRRMPFSVSD